MEKADLEMLLMDDSEMLAATRGVRPSRVAEAGDKEDAQGQERRASHERSASSGRKRPA